MRLTVAPLFFKLLIYIHIKPVVPILSKLPLDLELKKLPLGNVDLTGLKLPSPLSELELHNLQEGIQFVGLANNAHDGAEYKVYPDDIKSKEQFAKEKLGLKQHVDREVEDDEGNDSEEVDEESESEESRRRKRSTKKKSRKSKKKLGKSDKGVDMTKDKDCPVEIYDQRTCASCYAWAVKLAAEYELCKEFGKKVELSVQEVVDCSNIHKNPKFGNFGCAGGHMTDVAHYYQNTDGWTSYPSYPYKSKETQCKVDLKDPDLDYQIKPTDFNITYVGWPKSPYKEEDIVGLLDQHKPVIMSIYSNDWFRHYSKGILGLKKDEPCACPKTVNHAVTIFGYGYDEETGQLYFKGVNTWSKQWGEKGTFRFAANKNCLCCEWEIGIVNITKLSN